jgi:NAD(P)-dependent dehydrogenase (short-subunit alcohol dehydrogenase family)
VFAETKCVLWLLQALLLHNAKVYMAMRNRERGEAAIEILQEDTGKTAIFLKLDLADLKSVKATSEEFLRCVYTVIRVHPYVYLTVRYGQQGERTAYYFEQRSFQTTH